MLSVHLYLLWPSICPNAPSPGVSHVHVTSSKQVTLQSPPQAAVSDRLRLLPAGTCVTELHKRSSKHISLHVPPQGAVADLPSL